MSNVISASLVKSLRERTGAGMMECKQALESSQGDIDRAIEALRKSGRAKADKKQDRDAKEGMIAIIEEGPAALMLEVNSETDFVARDHNFVDFVKATAQKAWEGRLQDVAQLSEQVEEARLGLIAKVGENIQVRRVVLGSAEAGTIGTYLHGNRIGVIVELNIDNKSLARDIAMHIAASRPLVVNPQEVPADVVAKEKEIYAAQAAETGKPAAIVEKMVEGRLKKYLDEVSLLGQPFVKDPNITVGRLLEQHHAKVLAFYRYAVGE
jgi:elongation factor Ts